MNHTGWMPGAQHQRAQWARDVLLMMTIVEMFAAGLLLIGVLARRFVLPDVLPVVLLLLVTAGLWLCSRRFTWNWLRAVPALACCGLGFYAYFDSQFSISMLFFALAIFLAGMLINRAAQWAFLAASVGLSTLELYLRGSGAFSQNLAAVIINSSMLVGLSLLQWYYDTRLERVLQGQIEMNRALAEENRRGNAAETALMEQDRQLRRLAENTSDLVAEIGPQGTARYVSPSYGLALGYRPESLLGSDLFDMLHPADRPGAIAAAIENARTHQVGKAELRVRHIDGHFIPFETIGTPLYTPDGRLDGFVLSSRDISAQKAADQALRMSEDKFSKAFLTSPDSININRLSDGLYIDVNEGFSNLTGFAREEVIGRTSMDINIWADPEDRARLVKMLTTTGVAENMEARFRLKDGTVKVGLMSARTIEINHERCILSFTRDISERIRAVQELRDAHDQLEQAYEDTLQGWVRALELREHETADHSRRVVELTLRMARALNLEEAALLAVERGALLHDIGKIGVPDSILLKPGPLTPEEWTIMRYHPRYAYELLERIPFLRESMEIPYCHHERWDGGGYPRGIAGECIPLPARIFAVIDVYDALLSDRPYRPAWSQADALRYLVEQKGRQFDPAVVDVFVGEI